MSKSAKCGALSLLFKKRGEEVVWNLDGDSVTDTLLPVLLKKYGICWNQTGSFRRQVYANDIWIVGSSRFT